ncbi:MULTISPECIES: winged helix-turn-helix domain-containing protein [Sphingobacterium]|uniref:winged helix-turn-helix domain-containing protein n=1 Tax=Sphingobacterium TaxID=28453 RepID=UPI0013DD2133|nr:MULTISPECIES: LysR family transcriptional regulator [unclassified Sphingobacterium]
MAQQKNYTIKVRIWIEEDNGPFLGYGKVKLLENIQKIGSITNAAKEMGMSYKKAWELVNVLKERSVKPLVHKIIGGSKGSGAELTNEGEAAVQQFYCWKTS